MLWVLMKEGGIGHKVTLCCLHTPVIIVSAHIFVGAGIGVSSVSLGYKIITGDEVTPCSTDKRGTDTNMLYSGL